MPGGKRTLNSDGKFINSKSEKLSVSAVVKSNAANWLKATKALQAQEKAKSGQYITQSIAATQEFKKVGFSGKSASTLESDVGVNAQHYDNNDVPKMSLVPTQEINTDTYNSGNKSLARQLESKTYGVDGDKNLITPGNETSFIDETSDRYGQSEQNVSDAAAAVAATVAAENARQNDRIENIAKASDDQAYVDNSRRLAAELQKKDKINESAFEREQEIKKRVNKIKKEEKAKKDSAARLKKINDKTTDIATENLINQAESATREKQAVLDLERIKPIDAEKDAATAVFMNNYSDDQVYQPSFDGALNNEILNTSDSDIKETVQKTEDLKESEVKKSIDILNNRAEIERLNNLKALKTLGLSDDNAPYVQDKEKGTYETDNMTVFRPREIELENDALLKTQKIKDELEAEKQQAIADKLAFQDGMMNQLPGKEDIAGNNSYFVDSGQELAQGDIKESMIDQEKGFVDVIAGTTAKDMTTTVRDLAAERAEAERLASKSNDLTSSVTIGELNAQRVDAAQAKREQMEAYNKSLYSQPSVYLDADTEDKSQTSEKYPAFKTLGDGDGSLHGKDPFRFTTLEYPKNITSDVQYGHYILFYVNVQNKTKYNYVGYNDLGNAVTVGDVIETQTYHQKITQDVDTQQGFGEITSSSNTQPETGDYTTRYSYNTGAGADPVAFQKEAYGRVYEGGKANILQSNQVTLMRQRQATQGIASRTDLTSRITDSVAMYLPSEVGNTTATKYQGAELGMLGYLALGGADLLGQLQNRDFAGMGDTAVGMIDAAITEGLKKSAVTAADLFSGASTQGSIDKVFGQTVNPFIEVAFESMGVRSFEYTFNFSPKSRPETDEVKAIIQLFRFHMVPELKGTNHRYLTLPSTFDIHYMYQASPEESKENTFYNKIATCVLEDCSVNYAPSGVKSFDDGAPTQISMTLRFMETEMLTKKKVNDGF